MRIKTDLWNRMIVWRMGFQPHRLSTTEHGELLTGLEHNKSTGGKAPSFYLYAVWNTASLRYEWFNQTYFFGDPALWSHGTRYFVPSVIFQRWSDTPHILFISFTTILVRFVFH